MDSYVSFPELGIKLPISETIVSFELFGMDITLRWYGLLIALGFLLAVWYAFRNAKRFDLKTDAMIDVVLVCTIFGFIGARLYYVVFSDDRAAYFSNPISILQVWNGGLAIYGGIIFAFVTALWMCKLRRVDTLRMFDIAAPGFLIGQAIGRWGNFFNQEAFGGNTDLPWGMTGSWIGNSANPTGGYSKMYPVHPTFLYESLWCLLGLIVLHTVVKKSYKFKGQVFSLYVIWYGTGRFFIEMLRTDSLYWGSMRVSCLVAAVSVLGGVVLYFTFRAFSQRPPKELVDDDEVLAELAKLEALAAQDEQAENVIEENEVQNDGFEN